MGEPTTRLDWSPLARSLAVLSSHVLAKHHPQGYHAVNGQASKPAIVLKHDFHGAAGFENRILVDDGIDLSCHQQRTRHRRQVMADEDEPSFTAQRLDVPRNLLI